MTVLTAEFDNPELAAAGVASLVEAGFGGDDVEIFSNRPVELDGNPLRRRSRTSLFAGLGALISGGLATVFVFFTQRDYPLVTGGMPLNSAWATGVVSYELTMAGAMAGIVIALLWEGGLLRGSKHAPPPALQTGLIYVRVECGEEKHRAASERLRQAGAVGFSDQPGVQ